MIAVTRVSPPGGRQRNRNFLAQEQGETHLDKGATAFLTSAGPRGFIY
jgi:hypothetical protein